MQIFQREQVKSTQDCQERPLPPVPVLKSRELSEAETEIFYNAVQVMRLASIQSRICNDLLEGIPEDGKQDCAERRNLEIHLRQCAKQRQIAIQTLINFGQRSSAHQQFVNMVVARYTKQLQRRTTIKKLPGARYMLLAIDFINAYCIQLWITFRHKRQEQRAKEELDLTVPPGVLYLALFLPKSDRETVKADLVEEFPDAVRLKGVRHARFWAWWYVASCFWPYLKAPVGKIVQRLLGASIVAALWGIAKRWLMHWIWPGQ